MTFRTFSLKLVNTLSLKLMRFGAGGDSVSMVGAWCESLGPFARPQIAE